jgi:hypothetical protein
VKEKPPSGSAQFGFHAQMSFISMSAMVSGGTGSHAGGAFSGDAL